MEFCLNKTKLRCGKHDFKIEVVVGMYVLINRCFCFSLFILYMHGDVCSKLFCYYTSPLFITVTVPPTVLTGCCVWDSCSERDTWMTYLQQKRNTV
jgi:hypothetical protein